MVEMRAFEYLLGGRFRRLTARPGQHDDAVLALALALFWRGGCEVSNRLKFVTRP